MPSQQATQNTVSGRRRNDWMIHSILLILLSCSLATPTCAFSQLQMAAYKPPVKSSVSKIRSPRWSSSSPGGAKPQSPMDPQGSSSSDVRQPSNQRASAAASIPDTSRSSSRSSFQERMRGVMNKETARVRIATKQRQSMPQNVHVVETLKDFQALVSTNTNSNSKSNSSNKLVVVRFYAPWCRACKAIQPIYYKMAHQFPNVVFLDVPCTEKNANLHHGLGVPSLPYGHIYAPSNGGLVEETKLNRKQFPQLARKLQSYVQGRCDLVEVGDSTCPYLPLEEAGAAAATTGITTTATAGAD
ncbi:MAG: hypothetical protein SGBAC_012144 [Bacillariaceae sp.]